MPKADATASAQVRDAVGSALIALADTRPGGPLARPVQAPGDPLAQADDALGAPLALVAFSGGLDSTVLLHAAAAAGFAGRVHAVHIHHGLQPAADAWPEHCRQQAHALGAGFSSVQLNARPNPGESTEAWARRERYAALTREAARLACAAVLMAHHADDQAETVLMRLARGAGMRGLSAMAPVRPHGTWQLVRPLLALPKTVLLAYAREYGLAWIDDPSNAHTEFARNRVRREVLPALIQAVPGAAANLVRAARLAQEAQAVLTEVASADLAAAQTAAMHQMAQAPASLRAWACASGPASAPLHRTSLQALSLGRRRLALREWVASLGLGAPSEAVLLEMLKQLMDAASACGEVAHGGWVLRRYRDWLWAEPERAVPVLPPEPLVVRWRGEAQIDLGDARLLITAQPGPQGTRVANGAGDAAAAPVVLTVRALASSTRVRLHPRGSSRTLKHWHQQLGIAARLRASLPGVFVGDRLVLVAGLGIHHEKAATDQPHRESALVLHWTPTDPADPRAALCALQHFEMTRV